MTQLVLLNERIKTIFLALSEGMENCKMSGKSQGILRWKISGNPEDVGVTFPAVGSVATCFDF